MDFMLYCLLTLIIVCYLLLNVCLYGCVFAVQLHAEVCYAECQLQRAALTFLQVQ